MYNQSHQRDFGSLSGPNTSFLDSLVAAANVINNVFSSSSCARSLCQVYTEKQLEFENRQDLLQVSQSSDIMHVGLTRSEDSDDESDVSSPVDRAQNKCSSAVTGSSLLEVQLYRQFLFDEESVVDNIQNRTECDRY